MTVVLLAGTTYVRTRGARKLPAETKTNGPAATPRASKDAPTEKPGLTGAHPM
jgi:hypothetical protein